MKVKLTVNGNLLEVVANREMTLLDLLRDELHLAGAKQSCDQVGQCGACTVIVDGKAVRSCLLRLAKHVSANEVAVEGLDTPESPHLIQDAFVLSGAVQCDYCILGMLMAT